MPIRHLLVLALPNGVVSGTGHLSVYLGPRLRENGELRNYPDFSDWASKVQSGAGLQFTVTLNGAVVAANRVTVTSRTTAPPITNAWRSIFGPPATTTFPVKQFLFVDRSDANLVARDSSALASLAERLIAAETRNGGLPLTKTQVIAAAPELVSTADSVAPWLAPVGNGTKPTAATLDNEFHATLRMLAAHPHLLRRLGLLWDLEITAMPTSFTSVSVATNWATMTGAPARHEVPVTTSLEPTEFRAKVLRTADRSKAWLKLGSTASYGVTQVETGQVAQEITDLAAVLSDPTVPGDALVELPAFVDGGIGVAYKDVVDAFLEQFERQRDMEDAIDKYVTGVSSARPTALAEDLTSGFRLDVQRLAPAPTTLHLSLHDRQVTGSYEFPSRPALVIAPPPDEGWSAWSLSTDGTPDIPKKSTTVQYGEGVRKKEGDDNTAWRLGDQVAIWTGWSLSTPKPSRSTTGGGGVENRDPNTPNAEYPGNVVVDYEHIDGTLPRLRYGVTYVIRARCVDLGGNSPTILDTEPSGAASPQTVYGRMSPISAPLVIRRQSRPDPGVGDMPDILVIKSELGQSMATVTATDRFLFPTAVPQSTVERHGLPNGGNDPAAYSDLAARDAASLVAQCLIDPDTGEPVSGTAISSGVVTPGPVKPPITYLADPVGFGIAAAGLPGQVTGVTMAYGTWPTFEGVLLELRGGTTAPTTDLARRAIVASLPQGTTVVCRVSHTPDPVLVNHLRAYQLLTGGEHGTLDPAILGGLNTGISRAREITLVHAVRLPLDPPSFPEPMAVDRPVVGGRLPSAANARLGQTAMQLTGDVGLHRATTDQVAITARWTDPIDDVTEPSPTELEGHQYVGTAPVAEGGDPALASLDLTVDLGDTRRRTLVLESEGFCRYSRYFTELRKLTAVPGATTVLAASGVSGPSVEVVHRTNGSRYAEDSDYTVDPIAGSITIVSGGGIPNSTPLDIRFIRRPYSRLSAEAASGQSVEVELPASVAPLLPSVHAVLPAAHRSATATALKLEVTHDGRVVRVLLDRPWYSSGEGEELGVAVDAGGTLTRWGRDPLSTGTGPVGVLPDVGSFPLATATPTDVDGRFDVAAHAVTFDPQRDVWTADVLVDATFGYRPWVQLAVARYQSLAVDQAHVSDVVTCEMIRLGERRVVTVDKLGGGMVQVTVTGRDNVNTMTAVLQESPGTLSDEMFDWTDVRSVTLSRTGTTAASSHTAPISTAGAGDRRLVIEDREPVRVAGGAGTVASSLLVYREVIPLPGTW